MDAITVAKVIGLVVVLAALPALIAKARRAKRATVIAVLSTSLVAGGFFTYGTDLINLLALVWLGVLFWSILDARVPKAPKMYQAKPLYSK